MPEIFIVTNRTLNPGIPLESIIKEAVSAGADKIILREKDLTPAELYKLGCKIAGICSGTKTQLLINSSVETAIACDAAGVHLGAGCLPLEAIRNMVPHKTVGVSVHSVEEAAAAQSGGADYVLAGHIFPTASKPSLAGRGPEFIKKIRSVVDIPIIAIGGINHENAGLVIRHGAHGVAVMSVVMQSPDVAGTIHKLRQSIQ